MSVYTRTQEVVRNIRSLLKTTELALTSSCVIISSKIQHKLESQMVLIPLVFGTYIVVNTFVLLGYLFLGRVRQRKTTTAVDLGYTALGLLMYISTGGVYVNMSLDEKSSQELREDRNYVYISGLCAVVNGFAFVLDLLLSYKDVNYFTTPNLYD